LNTILRNLVSNAIKFTPKGGMIIITSTSDNGIVSLKVSDSGIGMSKEQFGQILNGANFIRKRGTQGEKSTGLGLVLCKDLIEQNKGTIKIISKEKTGTTFEVLLPAFEPKASK